MFFFSCGVCVCVFFDDDFVLLWTVDNTKSVGGVIVGRIVNILSHLLMGMKAITDTKTHTTEIKEQHHKPHFFTPKR